MASNNNFSSFNKHPIFFEDGDIIDERGSQYISLRFTQWVKDDKDRDESKKKLELRKWTVSPEGDRAGKGVSFLTEEGPSELAKVLVHRGYGDTKEILDELRQRDNFKESVQNLFTDDEENDEGDYFDIRDALLADDEIEEEDVDLEDVS